MGKQLHAADPMNSPNKVTGTGKEAQAERLCFYFEKNEQSAAPIHQALAHLENATNALIVSQSNRAAIAEEVSARTQLQKTMQSDIQNLNVLLELQKRGQNVSMLER